MRYTDKQISNSMAKGDALRRIADGADPEGLAHVIEHPGAPDLDYLSTSLPAGSNLSGYVNQYKTLAAWAGLFD